MIPDAVRPTEGAVKRVALIVASEVVSEWEEPTRVFVCPPPTDASDPCGCGYDGPWEYRWVYVWNDKAGHKRGDRAVRLDLSRGLPPRAHDEGWWVIAGRDDRCPSCGDIERFDNESGERVSYSTDHRAAVVPLRKPASSYVLRRD